jgi:DNA-binding transcriptional regulator YiaG
MGGLALITTFRQLLDRWPHRDQIAADLGVSYNMVDGWHRRGRVPPEHWRGILASAEKRGIDGIDMTLLTVLPLAIGCRTFRDVIDLWPSRDMLARDLNIPSATVRSWRVRNAIPEDVWNALITTSHRHGITGLNRGIMENCRHPPSEEAS